MNEEKPKWRRSDVISTTTLLTLAVWIWYAAGKVSKWDMVSDIKKGNDALDTRITVVETYLSDMRDDLKYIRRQVKRDEK